MFTCSRVVFLCRFPLNLSLSYILRTENNSPFIFIVISEMILKGYLIFIILIISYFLFQDLFKQGVSDYLLFIFAAVTNGEIGNDCQAANYYKKAAELDPEKPLAWQGLYRLYEQRKYADLDHVLIVIRNLLCIPGYVGILFKCICRLNFSIFSSIRNLFRSVIYLFCLIKT